MFGHVAPDHARPARTTSLSIPIHAHARTRTRARDEGRDSSRRRSSSLVMIGQSCVPATSIKNDPTRWSREGEGGGTGRVV